MKNWIKKTILMIMIGLLVLSLCACTKKSPIDNNGVYSDDFASFTLPEEHFIAVDSSEEMGNKYHKYLLFKGATDYTGSNIIYMSYRVTEKTLSSIAQSQEMVERNLKRLYEKDGKTLESVSFKTLDMTDYKGFVYEYIVSSENSAVHHIMYSAAKKSSRKAVTVFFNCMDDDLLDEYKACCESITIY